ncbi:13230_t:CDS:10 [Acaulospora colombiana]|uniref:13230_t:CDS:1 n=1 Tax=Acaulospora colombiana TaxID=27376 RepID=A0ACA9JW50_9GLOM|nr:13230_t:CDS:10 [Acaulospora colombiana]
MAAWPILCTNGYFPSDSALNSTSKVLGKIGFPVVVDINPTVIKVLKESKRNYHVYSSKIVKTYLQQNQSRLQELSREETLDLLSYVFQDGDTEGLEGLRMIPLADRTWGAISKTGKDIVYICSDKKAIECERKIFTKDSKKFIDSSIPDDLWNLLYKGAEKEWNINIKKLTTSAVANLIRENLEGYCATSDEIELKDQRDWVYLIWDSFVKREYELKDFETLHLIPTHRGTLRKIKTNEKCIWNILDNELDNKVQPLIGKFGVAFVDKDFEKRYGNTLQKLSSYVVNIAELPSVLLCLHKSTSYPRNLEICLQTKDALEIIDYLNAHLQTNGDSKLSDVAIDVMKKLPIFSEIGHEGLTSLHKKEKWGFLPKEEEGDYVHMMMSDSIGFLDASSNSNARHILEDVIKITRLTQIDYWRDYVIPNLTSQSSSVFNTIVEKLFDRLKVLLQADSALSVKLGQLHFVTAGTYNMFKDPPDFGVHFERRGPRHRPMDLYNPNDQEIVDLFFEDEEVFPCENFSQKLKSLMKLGLKTHLLPDDIIKRLRKFQDYKNKPGLYDTVHTKAMKLLKYIDNNWKIIFDKEPENVQLLSEILVSEWIPTVDHSGKKHFTKPSECGDLGRKGLICYVEPILDYRIKHEEFLKCLGWDKNPDINVVLRQLEECSKKSSEISNIYEICDAIYKHMNAIVIASDEGNETDTLKKNLGDMKWILVDRQFYSSKNVVFDLSKDFGGKDTLVVGLPDAYKCKYEELFKRMGVRSKIGISDYIDIIKVYVQDDPRVKLSVNEIDKVVGLIDQISKMYAEDKSSAGTLQELLVPTTQEILVNLSDVQYDDMGSRSTDEEKKNYHIAHSSISLSIAKKIRMKMLSVKEINGANDGFEPEFFEQSEPLIIRIRNIINDYLPKSIFKEFLQNADDAGARVFKLYIDERDFRKKDQSSLLTEGMHLWQGPALWIYNDAEFSEDDFKSLLKLGGGFKLSDKTKIGRFGIGFNSVFNFTDLPSFVSGEYIAFLDPHSKYLPELGNPPRNPLGNRYNFVKSKFTEKWYGQAAPYISVEGCDLTKRYNGTLFRIPLRNHKSKITDKIFDSNDLLNLFKEIQGNREMLFLRNIEKCSVHYLDENRSRPIWEASVNEMNETIRNARRSITDETRIFQFNVEMKISNDEIVRESLEHWLLCLGGSKQVRDELKKFSDTKKPRGGVAALIAQRGENDQRGEMYSYLSLSISNGLSVMLNGDFFLSSDRSNILHSESAEHEEEKKWNRYILLEVLPSLHANLLKEIANGDSWRFESLRDNHNRNKKFTPHITTRDWPIKSASGIYQTFGLTVLQELARNDYRVFWTEANGGKFIPFSSAVFAELKKGLTIIPDLLTRQNIQIVKVSENQYKHLEELSKQKSKESKENHGFLQELSNSVSPPYFITPDLVCNTLRNTENTWDSYIKSRGYKNVKKVIDDLLKFILEGTEPQDTKGHEKLIGLPLVPLYNDTVGTFCKMEYYIADEEYRKLFNKTKLSHFVRELPFDIKNKNISELLKISELDVNGILNLFEMEFPMVEQMKWDPSGESYPNRQWLHLILAKFSKDSEFEFNRLARFPLLPVIHPHGNLIRFDKSIPLLFKGDLEHFLIHLLSKLGVRFTDLKLTDTAHPTLKECVMQPTAVNIFKSMELHPQKPMEEMFRQLNPSEISEIRSFVKRFTLQTRSNEKDKELDSNILKIIQSLPVWPIHSHDNYFIAAKNGCLIKSKLKLFSFVGMKVFKFESDEDYDALSYIKAKPINELEYITHYYKHMSVAYSTGYMKFLQSILLLRDNGIEKFLKDREVIPNKDCTLVKVSTLYDGDVNLFSDIFRDADKFLHVELQENKEILDALGRMGLKRCINSQTFIECALEIESKFHTSPKKIKPLARKLAEELVSRYEKLSFDRGQCEELLSIKFVPTDTYHKERFGIRSEEIVSLNLGCFYKYNDLVWTQVPIFDESLNDLPIKEILRSHSNLCEPKLKDVINHWETVATKITRAEDVDWGYYREKSHFQEMMKEIYKYINSRINQNNRDKEEIKSKIRGKKLFLNRDDPFEPESWVSGPSLIFGNDGDSGPDQQKVTSFLEEYKDLLILAGAEELKNVESGMDLKAHDQGKHVLDQLLNFLKEREETPHGDVAFCFSNNETIYANRSASQHFKDLFCNHKIEVPIKVKDFEPDTFRALLRWLYGQPFEEVLKEMSINRNITFLIDLFKASTEYKIDQLKNILEKALADECNYNLVNVIKIIKGAKLCDSQQLEDHCLRFIKENKTLMQKRLRVLMDARQWEEMEMLEKILDEINRGP